MNMILDTHALIWFLSGDKNMSEKAKAAIEDQGRTKFVSIASIWEMAIKISLGKLKIPKGFEYFLKLIEENGFLVLPIEIEHTVVISTLDFIHRDPFDRVLIAQSKTNKIPIVTRDNTIRLYDVETIW